MLFFTRQAELRERPRDGRAANFDLRLGRQVLTQLAERGVVVGGDCRAQWLVVSRPEARDVPAAVRAGREASARAVQQEHLVDEGQADAE